MCLLMMMMLLTMVVRCFLMLKFAEVHRTQFSRMRTNTRIERTNPICLMNHFSVFNANYGRSFSCSRFKHVWTRMRMCVCGAFVWLSIISTVPESQKHLCGRNKYTSMQPHFIHFVYYGNHILFCLQRKVKWK